MRVTAVSFGCKFPIYCCPVNFKTAEKSNPKPFSIGLRAFFFKDQAPESQIMMVGFAAGGRTRAEWACPKRVVQRRRVSLSCGRKTSLCSSYFPYQPQGAGRRANVSRLGGTASLGPVPIGRDQAKSRWFSKSKSICVGGLGKVPRLCAIWTPQCGGMKGKLCFIKRKNRSLVSNGRIFREKNASFFEGMERVNENLWTFLRNASSFLFFLPAFFRKDARSFADHDTRRFLIRTSVRVSGHAPTHRALSEFAIPAFTLHLHPQFVDTVCFVGEGLCPFLPSPVKERGVKSSPSSR